MYYQVDTLLRRLALDCALLYWLIMVLARRETGNTIRRFVLLELIHPTLVLRSWIWSGLRPVSMSLWRWNESRELLFSFQYAITVVGLFALLLDSG